MEKKTIANANVTIDPENGLRQINATTKYLKPASQLRSITYRRFWQPTPVLGGILVRPNVAMNDW